MQFIHDLFKEHIKKFRVPPCYVINLVPWDSLLISRGSFSAESGGGDKQRQKSGDLPIPLYSGVVENI